MDHSPSLVRSDDAPPPGSPESQGAEDVSDDAGASGEPEAEPTAEAKAETEPEAEGEPDAERESHAEREPHAETEPDAERESHAEREPDVEPPEDVRAAEPDRGPSGREPQWYLGAHRTGIRDREPHAFVERYSLSYPDDSLWPAGSVPSVPSEDARVAPRTAADSFPLVSRDSSRGYPIAIGPVQPRSLNPSMALRRPRPRVVVLAALAVVLAFASASVGYSLLFQQKLYGAQTEFMLVPRSDLSDTAADQATQTQLLIVTSAKVLQTVADRTGVPVPVLQDEVAAAMEGRSTLMRITVTDPDQNRAVAIARAVGDAYPQANPKPTASQPAAITVSQLTAARALDQPVEPQPTRALAVGILVGMLAAALVVVVLWRPWGARRPAPFWT